MQPALNALKVWRFWTMVLTHKKNSGGCGPRFPILTKARSFSIAGLSEVGLEVDQIARGNKPVAIQVALEANTASNIEERLPLCC